MFQPSASTNSISLNGKATITDALIDMAAREALPPSPRKTLPRWLLPTIAGLLLVVAAFALGRSDWLRAVSGNTSSSQGAGHVADP